MSAHSTQLNQFPKRTVILTTAMGYSADIVSPLLSSIERFSPEADVVLFVDETQRDMLALIGGLKINITIIGLKTWRRTFREICGKRYKLANAASAMVAMIPLSWNVRHIAAKLLLHPCTLRYLLYAQWLRRNSDQYDQVFMIDARDVMVLGDLTKLTLKSVTLAEESLCVHEEPMNLSWLYGIGNQPIQTFNILRYKIICSGVIAAPIPDGIEFLEDYSSHVIARIAEIGNRYALDQAVVNWLLRTTNWSQRANVLPFKNEMIMNLGTTSLREIADWINNGVLQEKNLPLVLHQYDRLPMLDQALRKWLEFGVRGQLFGIEPNNMSRA